MKKIFLIAVFLLMPLITQAQTAVYAPFFNGGSANYFTLTAVDSLTTYYTDFFDITHMDGQTIYVGYDYVTPGTTADTLKVTLEAAFPGTESAGPYFTVDTTYFVGNSTSYYYLRAISTFFSFAPRVRAKIENTSSANRDGTLFRFFMYAKIEDYVPTAQFYGNVKP